MLVLKRKIKQGVRIGDDVEVYVAKIEGGEVTLAVRAPSDKKIYRNEIYDSVKETNSGAASRGGQDADALRAVSKLAKGKGSG